MRKIFLIILIFGLFLLQSLPVSSCGIASARVKSYLKPGQITSWTLYLFMEDNNGDGNYTSSVSISDIPHPEFEWASLSPDNFTLSIIVNSITDRSMVSVYINRGTKYLPFGNNFFEVTHSCECSSGQVGGCAAVISQAWVTIIPWDITGLQANFSSDDISNVILTWDEFTETSLDYLVVLRMVNTSIGLSNYQDAEVIANLSANATTYVIKNSDPCIDYRYAIYGYTSERLMATSATVSNPNFGPPKPFSLLYPVSVSTNSSSVNFTWEETNSPYPSDEITYTLYLANNSDFLDTVVIENIFSNEYNINLTSGQSYFWKVKATDSCKFETYASDQTNYALQQNGGVASAPNANDGNYSTDQSVGYDPVASLSINMPLSHNIGRIRLNYRTKSTQPELTHNVEFYGENQTLLKEIERNPFDQIIQQDFTIEPLSTSSILASFYSPNTLYVRFIVWVYEFELYELVSSFVVLDFDYDTIPDDGDNCPDVYNPDQEDTDGDNIGNVCDNCPGVYNSNQNDFDHDGIGDICDSTVSIMLTKGWNLISIPSNLANKSINSVFNNFSYIFSFNNSNKQWLFYENESINNFNIIDKTKGYWINSLNNQTLTIEGTEFTYPINFTLKKGWNLISYPSLNKTLVNESLKDVACDLILTYEGNKWLSYSPNKPFYLNTLKNLTPYHGYWVKVNENVIWGFDGAFNK